MILVFAITFLTIWTNESFLVWTVSSAIKKITKVISSFRKCRGIKHCFETNRHQRLCFTVVIETPNFWLNIGTQHDLILIPRASPPVETRITKFCNYCRFLGMGRYNISVLSSVRACVTDGTLNSITGFFLHVLGRDQQCYLMEVIWCAHVSLTPSVQIQIAVQIPRMCLTLRGSHCRWGQSSAGSRPQWLDTSLNTIQQVGFLLFWIQVCCSLRDQLTGRNQDWTMLESESNCHQWMYRIVYP